MSIGDSLAQARSQAGLTISQVSQRTCIRETIIRDIERDDFSSCGGDFYARGHIRSIARAVGLDPEELTRAYDLAHGAPQAITAADVFEPATPIKLKERRSLNWSIALVVVLLAVLSYGGFRLLSGSGSHAGHASGAGKAGTGKPSRPTQRAPASPAVGSPASAAPAKHRHTVVIHLTALQDCWVEFLRPDGAYLKQAYVVGGATKSWTFRHAVEMRIGNPGGILLSVNGKNLGKPGGQGQPVTLSFGPGQQLPSPASGLPA